jgi:16S rRNA G966 N2-methylase RsmD
MVEIVATPKGIVKIESKYSKVVGPLTADEYNLLKNSIKANGLYHPIITNKDGVVLDGHHRLRACRELCIPPRFETKEFDSKESEELFVIESNTTRRQLSRLKLVELLLKKKPLLQSIAKKNMLAGKTLSSKTPRVHVDELLATEAKMTKKTFHNCERVLRWTAEYPTRRLEIGHGYHNARTYDDIRQSVENEDMPVRRAYNLIRANEDMLNKRAEVKKAVAGLKPSDRLLCLNMDSTKVDELGDMIPDNSVDLIISDPPYTFEATPEAFKGLAELASRKLRDGGSLVFYFGHYHLMDIGKIIEQYGRDLHYCWIIAVKHEKDHGILFHKRKIVVGWKPMLWYLKGDKRLTDDSVRDFIQSELPDKNNHRWAQSPIEAEYLIKTLTSGEGATVLDPFLGSGAFAVPAIKLGRWFIGIEIDPDVYSRAKDYIIKMTQ